MEKKMKARQVVLREAEKCVCSDRNNQYGEPEDNFRIIADLWEAYLVNARGKLTAKDVAAMMILFKVGRISSAKRFSSDTWIDIAGYAACGAECAADYFGMLLMTDIDEEEEDDEGHECSDCIL